MSITYHGQPARILSADERNLATIQLRNGKVRCLPVSHLSAANPFELARALKAARTSAKQSEKEETK